MSGLEARQLRDVVRFVESSRSAPMHEIVTAIVAMAPALTLDLFQIALADCCEFRLENRAEIDDMLRRAIERRVV